MNLQLQEELIEHTQELIANCLNSGSYPEAIAFGGLLKDLTESYKVIGAGAKPPVVQLPMRKQQPQQQAFSGSGAFGVARTIPQQRQQPPKPTTYQWADGFEGVTLPNPPEQQEAEDYWQDPRRQQ